MADDAAGDGYDAPPQGGDHGFAGVDDVAGDDAGVVVAALGGKLVQPAGGGGLQPQAPRFLELLADLLRPDPVTAPGLIGAGTIRADRYEPLQTAPELAGVRSVVFDELKPMPPAEFKEVIRGPAERATRAGRPLTVEPDLWIGCWRTARTGADTCRCWH